MFPGREEGFVSSVVHEGGGRYLASRNSPVRCLHDPILVETMAIKEALLWEKGCGWQNVAIYSSCQLVCNLLKSSSSNYSYVGYIVRDCVILKRHFVDVLFHFVLDQRIR